MKIPDYPRLYSVVKALRRVQGEKFLTLTATLEEVEEALRYSVSRMTRSGDYEPAALQPFRLFGRRVLSPAGRPWLYFLKSPDDWGVREAEEGEAISEEGRIRTVEEAALVLTLSAKVVRRGVVVLPNGEERLAWERDVSDGEFERIARDEISTRSELSPEEAKGVEAEIYEYWIGTGDEEALEVRAKGPVEILVEAAREVAEENFDE